MAVVFAVGLLVNAVASVSLFRNPLKISVKVGMASPSVIVSFFTPTVSGALVMVSVPAT